MKGIVSMDKDMVVVIMDRRLQPWLNERISDNRLVNVSKVIHKMIAVTPKKS